MLNIQWHIGDVVLLAGRRGKIVDVDDGPLLPHRVEWEEGSSNTLNLPLFPEAKKIEPEITFSKAQVEAIKGWMSEPATAADKWLGTRKQFEQWLDSHTT